MTDFLTKPLNEMFAGGKRVTAPATRVVAYDAVGESEITKGRDRLWSVTLNGHTYKNSRLGDLIEQAERYGFTVERRTA